MAEYLHGIWATLSTMFIGLGITWKHMMRIRKGNVTLQYPEEKWPRPERNIGFDFSNYNVIRSRLHQSIDDCIGCMKCARACPVDCITIEIVKVPKGTDLGTTSNDTKKRLLVKRFDIDMSECMYCNLCTYPCPESCIFMTGGPNSEKHPLDYEFSEYNRENLIYKYATVTPEEIERLTAPPPEPPPTTEKKMSEGEVSNG
ncbi:MAG: 4Fe-4S dicluster domain-containing protein [Candidatus Marinimicrobia bacterium]|nr:4Fe-4S dicluster domain-containing protein [Candidatus Neomarinimicrobiota bacterium]MBL7060028.1 4Fe-4S dicluster domain-containing protein [Candidatus Neomarinimicrobiota bacterium]